MLASIGVLSLGGAVGVLGRYGLSSVVARCAGAQLPWATLLVNVTGCFLVGFFDASLRRRGLYGHHARLLLMTGFCGGYTTFSTMMLEFDALIRAAPARAGAYLAASVALGLALLRLGLALGSR